MENENVKGFGPGDTGQGHESHVTKNIVEDRFISHFALVQGVIYTSGIIGISNDWDDLFQETFFRLQKQCPDKFEALNPPLLFSPMRYSPKLHYSHDLANVFGGFMFGFIIFDYFTKNHHRIMSYYGKGKKDEVWSIKDEKELALLLPIGKKFLEIVLEIEKEFRDDEFKDLKLEIAKEAQV